MPAPWPTGLARLLLPPGREATTINQLLEDDVMRKQNDYVEVGARSQGCEGPAPERGGGGEALAI